jgi:hypothetical protein
MRLADSTTFTVGHEVIALRVSLRAAIRLERQFGGFDKIVKAIAAGNLSVMGTVMRESSDERTDLADLLDCGGSLSVKVAVEHIAGPLIEHVFALAGIDPNATAKADTGKPITYTELHSRLFKLATGGLGWTPAQAYDAAPYEIAQAYEGRVELLRTIFGSGEPETADINDPAIRRQLNSIGDLANVTA